MADKTGEQVPKNEGFTTFTDDTDPYYSELDPNYATVTMATMNRENIYTEAATATKNTGKGEDTTTKNKKLMCLAAIMSIIIMLMLITCCFIASFLELVNLKSELSSFKQTLPSERAQHIDASIDRSFSTIEDKFEEKLQNTMQQLNISVQERLQDTVNKIDEQIYGNFEDRLTELEDIENLQNNKIQQINASLARLHPFFLATSCAALPPFFPSGYYWVRASNGSAVRVYCDMTRSCGGVTGGWMRVAELDMTNSCHQCPSGLRQRTDSNTRTCVRDSNSRGCSSVTFSSVTLEYSRVCGKIIGYQFASPDAFAPTGRPSNPSINTYYVDGVSITHGSPRQHIWTLAAAHNENNGLHLNCPCTNSNTASRATQPPAFVRNDYFCDTGSSTHSTTNNFNDMDPLWDGAGCGPLNTCCSFNNPPWFYKQLPQPTTDDIEMRVCRDEDASNEDIAIEMVEIYIR